jgi:hypothetical protein
MPGRLLLSPLVENGTLRRPPAGQWHQEGDFLNQFSRDILVEGTVSHQQIVRGVPSVFAQPIYFAHALEDDKHPAHHAAVSQWRGLLACFALQRWAQIPLSTERFDLFDAASESSPGASDHVFRQVLRSQLPAPEDDWREWWLIRCDGKLLGATSPWTIVYPPAHQQIPVAVPWQRKGVFVDPIDHYDPRRRQDASRELALLGWWLDQLLAGHQNRWGAPVSQTWDRALALVTQALDAWRDDLAPYRTSEEHELSPSTAEAPLPYGSFVQTVVPGHDVPSESLLIRDRQGMSRIVLKRKGLEEHRRIYSSILANELDLESMPPSAPAGWRTRAGREVEVGYLFAEELFLTSRLLEIPQSEHALSWGSSRFALPLRSEISEYFDFEHLSNGTLEVEFSEREGRPRVQLTFPLSDGSSFTVERVYDPRQDIVSVDPQSAPVVAFWPDFVSESWSHYLGLFVSSADTSLTVRPLTADGASLVASPSERDNRPWVAWQSDQPISGFQFSESGEEIGLVMRRQISRPRIGDGQTVWHVAVDFGTSNTQLTYRVGKQGQPQPLHTQGRTVFLTEGGGGQRIEAPAAYFPVVGDELATPFPSALFENRGWATHVTQPPGQLYSPRFLLKAQEELRQLVDDLKWPAGERGGSGLKLRHYLRILVQAIAADAVHAGVTKLVFHWSYPLALPTSATVAMRAFWETVPSEFTRPGFEVSIVSESGRSESEAMSRFFAHLPGDLPFRASSLSIAIDVGGGSTDIGFWSANRFLDQLSFKLAGNDLLVPLARRVPGFLESLSEVCTGGRPTDAEIENIRGHLAVSLNVMLQTGVKEISNAIHGRLSAGEPPWSVARTVIYLFFTGVSFYLGLHSRLLLDRLDKAAFALLFGGKASGLLAWLSNDHQLVERVLGQMFLAGLGYDDAQRENLPVKIYGPANRKTATDLPPKIEVAYGLLLPSLDEEDPALPSTTVVGEQGWKLSKDGEALSWDEPVDLDLLTGLHSPGNLDSGFAAYLAATLAPKYAEELNLDFQNLQHLRLDVQAVENAVRTLAGHGVLQPVFATELKQLIDQYLDLAS